MSYLKFLKGLVDQEQVQHKNPKPITRSPETRIKKQPAKEVIKSNPDEFKDPECQQIINEILSM